jgi:large subunit ribosomal protein L25
MSTDRVVLEVKERTATQFGSRNVRRLRRDGLIPGVLYGKGAARSFVVGERDLRDALTGSSGMHAIVNVVIEGQETAHHAVVKDFQQHPIRGTITHIDFHEVRLDRPIETTVSIVLVGEAPGARVGGAIQVALREVRIEALPTAIPEHIEVSLETLELGEVLRLEDVTPPTGTTFLDDPQTLVVSCVAQRVLTDEELAAEEAAESGVVLEPDETEDTEAAEDDTEPESS